MIDEFFSAPKRHRLTESASCRRLDSVADSVRRWVNKAPLVHNLTITPRMLLIGQINASELIICFQAFRSTNMI